MIYHVERTRSSLQAEMYKCIFIYMCTCSVKISCVKIVFILLRELGLMAICGQFAQKKKKEKVHSE